MAIDTDKVITTVTEFLCLLRSNESQFIRSTLNRFVDSKDKILTFEFPVYLSNGSHRSLRYTGERHSSPKSHLVSGLLQDISAQKLEEHNADRTARLIRLAGDVAKFGGWRVALADMTVEWSEQTARIHGLTQATRLSVEEAVSFYLPEHRDEIKNVFQQCVNDGSSFEKVLQLRNMAGKVCWVRSVGEAEYDQNGKIVAVYGALQDISDLVHARQKAERLNHRLYDTLEKISDAFFALDEQWNFVFINSQAEKIMRKEKADLLEKSIWSVFPELIGTVFEEHYRLTLNHKVTRCFTEFFAPLDSWFDVSMYPLNDGLAVYFRDVTELKMIQLHLEQLEDRQRHSQKLEALGQLTGGIAHEFNNIFTVIMGNNELIEASYLDEASKLSAQLSVKAAQRGARLTQHLLAFSRKQPLSPKVTLVPQLINVILQLFGHDLDEMIRTEVNCSDELWPVLIDPQQLEQAILQLVFNAKDAMPGGGLLSIHCENLSEEQMSSLIASDENLGSFVVIRISDTGIGMSEEVQQRAFEPFFTTKDIGKGSGLGLSMVYGFATQSGGYVRLNSTVNVGTTVELFLPTGINKKWLPESKALIELTRKADAAHILLVEEMTWCVSF
jgi:PAS domain S-box-containing protein